MILLRGCRACFFVPRSLQPAQKVSVKLMFTYSPDLLVSDTDLSETKIIRGELKELPIIVLSLFFF